MLVVLFIEDEEQEDVQLLEQEPQTGKEQVEEQWKVFKGAYVEVCEDVLSEEKGRRGKSWLLEEHSWESIKERLSLKSK